MTKLEKYILSLLSYPQKRNHNHEEQIRWLYQRIDKERAKQCGMSKAIKEWLWTAPDCFLITHNPTKMRKIAQNLGWLPSNYTPAAFRALETHWENLHASAIINLIHSIKVNP